MSTRFFCSSPIQDATQVTLVDAEAHHLLHVLRAQVGDQVVVFDGMGCEFAARVAQLSRRQVELEILSREEVSRELGLTLVVAVPLPKGDRQRWLVEKLTELGVARLVPLVTEHSIARPEAAALDRLRRAVIEASKQCGRNRLLEIADAQTATQLFAQPASAELRIIAHPAESSGIELPRASSATIELAVGPEGGWTDEEVATARRGGWQPVGLGPAILRSETAAMALAARFALPF